MTWPVRLPPGIGEEIGRLSPGTRRAVHDLLRRLAADPRDIGTAEPVKGAELRRALTAPSADTGERVTILYRIHPGDAGDVYDTPDTGPYVEIIFLVWGP
ncbi:hypothetical protein [Streptomyces chrestomyceticus]|uniref:hypothetical protein n=1 Tax=Streptomyces chrestomyceticus TaxID=68185 RepID=UPI0033C50020